MSQEIDRSSQAKVSILAHLWSFCWELFQVILSPSENWSWKIYIHHVFTVAAISMSTSNPLLQKKIEVPSPWINPKAHSLLSDCSQSGTDHGKLKPAHSCKMRNSFNRGLCLRISPWLGKNFWEMHRSLRLFLANPFSSLYFTEIRPAQSEGSPHLLQLPPFYLSQAFPPNKLLAYLILTQHLFSEKPNTLITYPSILFILICKGLEVLTCSIIINMEYAQFDSPICNNASMLFLGTFYSLWPLSKIISTPQKISESFSSLYSDYTDRIRQFSLTSASSWLQDFSRIISITLFYIPGSSILLSKDDLLHSWSYPL